MSNLESEINRPDNRIFRRAFIKRRQLSDGKYESIWTDISKYVKQYGSIQSAVDDVRLNKFTQSGINMTVLNDDGSFNDESNSNSLWSGFLSRYGTLLKIEAGYNFNYKYAKAGVSFAVGLRKLVENYSGNCIKIRRNNSADTAVDTGANDELDIGFNGFFLDITAINNFLDTTQSGNDSSDTAYITIWYDQSGNGNNITQTTSANQPKLSSCKTKISFDGTNDFLNLGSALAVVSESLPFTIYTRVKSDDIVTTKSVIENTIGANDRTALTFDSSEIKATTYDGSNIAKSGTANNSINNFLFQNTGVPAVSLYANGDAQVGTNAVTGGATVDFTVGAGTDSNRYLDGNINEIIVYPKIVENQNLWTEKLVELPAESTQGIYVLDQEIPISAETNDVAIAGSALKSVFDGVNAADITALLSTGTASEFIDLIKNHTDGAGNAIFQQFISAGAWDIQTTTTNYLVPDLNSLEDEGTTWEFMTKLAEAEGFVLYISRIGNLVFKDRENNTTTSMFSFKGQGFPRPNIFKITESKEALNKNFNFFRLQFKDEDTATSFVTAGTQTTVDPNNFSWKYGSKTYEFENKFIPDTATAQVIVNNLLELFKPIKNELDLTTKMHPDIDILDVVDISYHSYDLADAPLWDVAVWDVDEWGRGENFDLDNVNYSILSKSLNLDNLEHKFKVRLV